MNQSLDELLKGLKKKWRENLRRADRSGLNVVEGTGEDLYDKFMALYKEMHARKKFLEFVDIREFRTIQKDLPENQKMKIMICEHEGQPVAGLIWSGIGDTGIPIFSATGNKGLKLRGSYLLRWRMLEQLKERSYRFLDQGGINPQRNPGGYHFKAGMGGTEVCHIGQFDAYESLKSSFLVKTADPIRVALQAIRRGLIK